MVLQRVKQDLVVEHVYMRVRGPVPYEYVLITLKCGIKKIIKIKEKSQKKKNKIAVTEVKGEGENS